MRPHERRVTVLASAAAGLLLLTAASTAPAQNVGEIVAWGYMGPPPGDNSGFVAVAGGEQHSLGLKGAGSIVVWGAQSPPPGGNSNFVAVSACPGNGRHSLALRSDGSVVAWGLNDHGQCNVPTPNTGFVGIAAGQWHSLGLKADGSVVVWGETAGGVGAVPTPNAGFVKIAAGAFHNVGLKSDGTVVVWGTCQYGECTVPQPNAGFVDIAAGGHHCLALRSDGSIVAWGWNASMQCSPLPAPNTGFVKIAGGAAHSIARRSDGSIAAWGSNSNGQCNVSSPSGPFSDIAGGGNHTLAIWSGVRIIESPGDVSTCVGQSVTLAVTSEGLPPVSYQWRKRAVPGDPNSAVAIQDDPNHIEGSHDATLIIDPVRSDDAGVYDVVVSNMYGWVTSTPATLSVRLRIDSQPTGANRCAGDWVMFCTAASGDGPLTYQWRKDGTPIPGATYPCYFDAQVAPGDAGVYDCVLTNPMCSSYSEPAVLVVGTPPAVVEHPAGVTGCAGERVELCVSADGLPEVSYQWRRNGMEIDGAEDACLVLDPITEADAGAYDCVLSTFCGSVTTAAAILTVHVSPSITQSAVGQTKWLGDSLSLCVEATGSPPLTYQWRKNGEPIGGWNKCYTDTFLSLADSGTYDCVVSNACGVDTSPPIVIVVNGCPGDLNCDGTVDFFDIDAFVCALQGPPCYNALFPHCRYLLGDCDGDGYVTFYDIDRFVQLLGTPCGE